MPSCQFALMPIIPGARSGDAVLTRSSSALCSPQLLKRLRPEIDVGTEWSLWPEVELTVQYTHTFLRTNTSVAPYEDAHGDDRIGFQVQINF